jgi:hypothetical protein
MQLGSGTVNLMPGITYLHDQKKWSQGLQAMGTLPLGRNANGWRRGNQLRMSAWTSYSVRDWLAPSLRLEANLWDNIEGRDPTLDPLIEPQMDPKLQRGQRLDLLLGLNLYAPKGRLKGHRLTLEGGFPIYQNLKGPQLDTDWQITLAWSYTH